MGLELPAPRVDLADIRHKFHAAEREEKKSEKAARRTKSR
jgi:hypothetical protein